MNDRELLLKRLQICDFALTDAALYLDTHPKDQMALDYFKKYQALRAATVKDYTEKYGPVTHMGFSGGNRWDWTDGPWPWQQNREVR
jgi:spore coat protein JB